MRQLKQSRQDILRNTHETLTALVTYLQINEPIPGNAEYTVGDCLVYAIQTNTLIFKIDSALTSYERKTGDELLRLFVHREVLRHQLNQLQRRQTIDQKTPMLLLQKAHRAAKLFCGTSNLNSFCLEACVVMVE